MRGEYSPKKTDNESKIVSIQARREEERPKKTSGSSRLLLNSGE